MTRGLFGLVCQQAVAGNLLLATSCCKLQHVRIGLGNTTSDNHAARVANVKHIALAKRAIDLANTHRARTSHG